MPAVTIATPAPAAVRVVRNLFLVAISIAMLPLDLYFLMSAYVLQILLPFNGRRDARCKPAFTPKTILITGLGTTKGVAMARMFHSAGHDVIGAETVSGYLWPWGRFSKAVRTFYPLPAPTPSLHGGKVRSDSYFAVVRWIIREQKVSYWISCSEGVPAVFDAELAEMIARDTICKPFHFAESTTKTLVGVDTLMESLVALGLPVPDSHSVSSRDQIHQVLTRDHSPAPHKKPYIVRKSSEDVRSLSLPARERLRLPKRTISETYEAVAKVQINAGNPYILQEEVTGKRYSTHALVVANEVQTFAAFALLTELAYEALLPGSALAQAMLRYTQEFARRSPRHLTGHISFTFVVDEHATERGTVQLLFATDCKPRVTTACVLLRGRERELAARYILAGSSRLSNGLGVNGLGTTKPNPQPVVTPIAPQHFYWIGHDLAVLVCRSIWMCLTFQMSFRRCGANLGTFVRHVLFWKEATFEIWDPLPSLWLYHVQWPLLLLENIWSNQ